MNIFYNKKSPVFDHMHGGQSLQLIMMVQKELEQLAVNGRVVFVIFFKSLDFVWKDSAFFNLTRQILLDRLERQNQFEFYYLENWWEEPAAPQPLPVTIADSAAESSSSASVASSVASIGSISLESTESSPFNFTWGRLLERHLPAFFVVSSGSQEEVEGHFAKPADGSDFAIRHLILSVLCAPATTGPPLSCVRFDELEVMEHTSKGVAYTLPPLNSLNTNLISSLLSYFHPSLQVSSQNFGAFGNKLTDWLQQLESSQSPLLSNPRLILTIFALASSINDKFKIQPKSATALFSVSKLVLIHSILLDTMPLHLRSQPLEFKLEEDEQFPSLFAPIPDFLRKFLLEANLYFPTVRNFFKDKDPVHFNKMVDFIDSRLVFSVLFVTRQYIDERGDDEMSSLGWNDEELARIYESLAQLLKDVKVTVQKKVFPLEVPALFPLGNLFNVAELPSLREDDRSGVTVGMSGLLETSMEPILELLTKMPELPEFLSVEGDEEDGEESKIASDVKSPEVQPDPVEDELEDDWEKEAEKMSAKVEVAVVAAAQGKVAVAHPALLVDQLFADGVARGPEGFRKLLPKGENYFLEDMSADLCVETKDRIQRETRFEQQQATALAQMSKSGHQTARVRLRDIAMEGSNDFLGEFGEVSERLLAWDRLVNKKDRASFFPGFDVKPSRDSEGQVVVRSIF